MTLKSTASLAEVCEIVQGGRHKKSGNHFIDEGGYPAFGAGGLNGYLDFAEFEREGVILSSIGARCGKCFYASGKWTSLANTQVILPDLKRIHSKFLWYQLNDEARWPRAGTGQPFIKPSDVKSHKIFAPSYDEQKRIAAILDKADAIRRKRQEALRLTDDFLRSVFLDMFGDPVTNPMGWDTAPASEVFESFRYGTSAKCSEKQVDDDQLPVLRIPNIAQEKVNWDDLKYGDIPSPEQERLRLQAGDILFVRTNGNPDLIGRCAMFEGDRDAVYASYLIRGRIPADSDARPSFVHTLLCTDRLRAEIRQLATTSAGNYNINTKSLGSLPIILPSPALQNDFVRLKERIVDKQRHLLSFEGEATGLFAALQQRAFRGEL